MLSTCLAFVIVCAFFWYFDLRYQCNEVDYMIIGVLKKKKTKRVQKERYKYLETLVFIIVYINIFLKYQFLYPFNCKIVFYFTHVCKKKKK